MALSLELQQKPTYWRLAVSGDLDYGSCSRFRMSIDRILKSESRSAVVDLSGLGYLDSAGLGILLGMSQDHAAGGGRLVLITSQAEDHLLASLQLDGVFATAPTLDAAVLVLGNGEPTILHAPVCPV